MLKKLLFFIIFTIALLYSYELLYARNKATLYGVPKATNFINTLTNIRRFNGFIIGYSEFKKNPLWVMYKLKPFSPNLKGNFKRPRGFKIDLLTFSMVTHSDYTKKNYDRGHLAPNYAISRIYGRDAQLDTFFMTNISPQTKSFNRGIWHKLEKKAVELTNKYGEIWVVTGAIFDDLDIDLEDSFIEIPDSFYKIFIIKIGGKLHSISFIIPQYAKKNEKLSKFIVSIDKIEQLTGFDFFHKLEDRLENNLESEIGIL